MIKSYFTPEQLLPLWPGVIFILMSIIFWEALKKEKLSFIFLLLGSLCIRIFMALLDPYLNIWDEQFHGLVAKNMMHSPFRPTLFHTTVLPYDYANWTSNHVWLHKQPLFLWQMALSMKLFGVSAFTLRLPGILMSTAIVYFIYQIGEISISKRVGYHGALLFALSYFELDFVSGYFHSDHNDVAFLFYVTASIWAWCRYQNSKTKKWIYLIGIFAGMAILNKWLIGFLVYAGWFASILLATEKEKRKTEIKVLCLSAVVTLLIFIPWQVYILLSFPKESLYEYQLSSLHFSNVIEGHNGSTWFYFENIALAYGKIVPYLFGLALLLFYNRLKRNKIFLISFFTYIIFVYVFFTLAKTKMIGFCMIVSPLIFLALATTIDYLFQWMSAFTHRLPKIQSLLRILFWIVISYANLNFTSIQKKHTYFNSDQEISSLRALQIDNVSVAKRISSLLPSGDYILFNARDYSNIQIMFFTDHVAYSVIPSKEDLDLLRTKKIKMAFLNYGNLPEYISNDSSLLKISYPFVPLIENKIVNIQTSDRLFLTTDMMNGRKIIAKRNQANEWERFTLLKFQGDEYAFRSFDGKYLTADLNNGGSLVANRETLGRWELFNLQNDGTEYWVLKAANNMYVGVSDSTEGATAANKRTEIQGLRLRFIPLSK